jgi:branched-chain amino acid aminotransferase
LAGKLAIPVKECNFQMYDVYNADEAFTTATSRCILPVSRIDGCSIGNGSIPGAITQRLINAWIDMIGMDFVAQALHYAGLEE